MQEYGSSSKRSLSPAMSSNIKTSNKTTKHTVNVENSGRGKIIEWADPNQFEGKHWLMSYVFSYN